MADQESSAAANPPIAPQPQPHEVPTIYSGLRVMAHAIDTMVGGVKPVSEQLSDLANSVVKHGTELATSHKAQGDLLMGIAGTGEFGQGELFPEGAAELEGAAKKLYDGLRVRKASEVMVQPEETSRATPTGATAKLPAEIHADLEKQAGRPLSDEDAVALDRANLERGMVSAPAGNTNEIREAKRSQLEKPRSGTPKSIIEDAGLVHKGELSKGSGVHMFEHPDHPGKTAALKEPFTADEVKNKMNSKLVEFGVTGLGYTKK